MFKSDRGGIEIQMLLPVLPNPSLFKSDRGGIEILKERGDDLEAATGSNQTVAGLK